MTMTMQVNFIPFSHKNPIRNIAQYYSKRYAQTITVKLYADDPESPTEDSPLADPHFSVASISGDDGDEYSRHYRRALFCSH